MATHNSPGFIPINKLSETLGIGMPTLRRWEKNASMPASIRFGGRIRYWPLATLKRWVATLDCLPAEMIKEVWQGLETAALVDHNPTKNKPGKK